MKKSLEPDPLAPRPDLDFSKGVRGKYANLFKQGTNLVILDPELMPYFPDSASVHRALHAPDHQRASPFRRWRPQPAASHDLAQPRSLAKSFIVE